MNMAEDIWLARNQELRIGDVEDRIPLSVRPGKTAEWQAIIDTYEALRLLIIYPVGWDAAKADYDAAQAEMWAYWQGGGSGQEY